MKIFLRLTPALALGLISATAPVLHASATLPPAVQLTPVVSGLTQPTLVTNAGDGSDRLFIVEQTGHIKIFKNGSLLGTDFLDITGVSNFTGADGEMGLLGLAFDPNYSSNRTFYVTYTINTGNATFPYAVRLVRYQASSGNPDVADTSTATPILSVQKRFTNHDGGMIAFGPADGYLYWGTGDGGSGGDPDNNAQDLTSRLGKMLRIDVHTTTYAIPSDNPFAGSSDPNVKKEIWAYGLRNPWRWSFDRSTHDLLTGDVGQGTEEEIDFQPASSTGGENYGWNVKEGNLCYPDPNTPCTPPSNYVAPVATYDHGTNDSIGCAVTGGYVYRGSASPSLDGVYFYGDFCSGKLWAMVHNPDDSWSSKLLSSTGYNISSFGEDEAGELYLVDYGGHILQLSQVTVETASFASEGALDGTVVESSETSGIGGKINSTSQTFSLGDTSNRRQRRAILSFNTASLPDTAVILSATLSIELSTMGTTNPFNKLGKLKVDIARPRFGTKAALETLDFQATAKKNWVATISSTPSGAWYSGGIGASNARLISRSGRTQFRLRFALDDNNNGVADVASFFSGNAPNSADWPSLTVQYYVP